MASGFYLLDHPNPNGDHFYRSRNRKLVGQVIHITAGLEDIDLIGPDTSCESVSRYAATTDRSVSWHSGSDTDSHIYLLPYSFTAWQCVNYNSSTTGHEISKLETNWRDDDPRVVEKRLKQAADCLRLPMTANRIPFRKASKGELDAAISSGGNPVGMVGHGELDPTRRTDPGIITISGRRVDTFPWLKFIEILNDDVPKDWWDDVDAATAQVIMERAVRNVFSVTEKVKVPRGQTNNDNFVVTLTTGAQSTFNSLNQIKAAQAAVQEDVDLQGDDEEKILTALAAAEAAIIEAMPDTATV